MKTKHFQTDVARNIKEARRRRGLTQIDVEENTGIAYRHYQDIETGKVNTTIETLCRLAKAFKTTVAKLVKGRC